MFYDNLKNACEKNGLKVTPYATKLGLTTGIVGNWKKGGIPRPDLLIRMSEDLDVSIDYLLTGKEYMKNPATKNDDGTKAKQFVELLDKMDDKSLDFMIQLGLQLLEKQQKEKNHD